MKLRFPLVCFWLAVAMLGNLFAEEVDPVVGRWKFPQAFRTLKADGTCTDDQGHQNATWKCVNTTPPRKYEIIIAGGKFVNTVVLLPGNATLRGTNNRQDPILAMRFPKGAETPHPPAPAPATPTPPPALVATPKPAGSFSPTDPVVGKWKFPKGIRTFNGDGTCSDEQGQVMAGASWRLVDPTGDRKYAVTFNDGKVVHTMAIKVGGALLQWEDQPNMNRVAFRVRGETPTPAHPPTGNRVVAAPTPPIDTSRPAIKSIEAKRLPYAEVRPQAIHGDKLTFVYRLDNEANLLKKEVPLSSLRYKDLLAIEEYNPAFGQEPAFKEAKAGFYPRLNVGGAIGPNYTGVRVTSEVNGTLHFESDSGMAAWGVDQINPADLPGLRATETAAVLKANDAAKALLVKQDAQAAERKVKEAEERRRKMVLAAATGDYLDDRAAEVPNGALPIEYIHFMRQLGDPWTRKPGQVKTEPEHPPLDEWLRGLAKLGRGANPTLGKIVGNLQENVSQIYANERIQKQMLNEEAAGISNALTRPNRSGDYTNAAGQRVHVVDDQVSEIIGAVATRAIHGAFASLGESMIGAPDDRASWQRNEALTTIMSELGKIYPASPEKKGLLQLQLKREGIQLTNTSGQALTNLSVNLELMNFLAGGHPSEFRALFVSKLESGASLYLNPNQVRNQWYEGWKKAEARPEVACVWNGQDERWVWGTGGTLSARLNVWALEGHETATVDFPENGAAVALLELKNIAKALGEGNDKDRAWALEHTRQVLASLPAKSPSAVEARAILANPEAAAEKGRTIIQEILSNGLVGTYTGTLKIETGWIFGPKNKDILKRITAMNDINGPGKFVLEITGVTPDRQVQASMYPLGHPEMKRAFKGPAPALEILKNRTRLLPENGDPPPGADSAPATVAADFVDLVVQGRKVEGEIDAKVGKDSVRFEINGARPEARK